MKKKWRWIYATSTSFSDIWAARFISLSDWLEESKHRPDDKRDGKWTWSGFDMMSANAPIDQYYRHPFQKWEVGLERGGSWRLQLAVTALSNHITHHNVWESACLPHMMDRWQSSILYCFSQPPHVCVSKIVRDFVPIYILIYSQTILLIKISRYIVFGINTFY